MTLFTQSGRYYKQMRPSDAESLTQLFDAHAQIRMRPSITITIPRRTSLWASCRKIRALMTPSPVAVP